MAASTPDLAGYLEALRLDVEAALERALPSTTPRLLLDAMRYALAAGGKRLRPCLALTAAEAVASRAGEPLERARQLALPAACAIEMVHTYSLVHDDLPAMDDDTLRRGRPTSHVVYGDGFAILVGDGLLTEAFAIVTEDHSRVLMPGAPRPDAARRLRLTTLLAGAAGAVGMVGGQALDLAAAGRVTGHPLVHLGASELEDMHARKTGALIRAAAVMGAIAAGADDRTIAAIDDYARDLGLAFQIVDDVLDVEGSAAALGKTAGKDAAAGKSTYPAIHGLERSRQLAAESVERAKAAIASAAITGRLAELAEWSLVRRR